MNWVDAVIAIVVVGAAFNGRSQGALRQIGALAGLVLGLWAGTWVAPTLSVRVTSASWRPLLAIGIVIVCASLGSSLGSFLGGVANRALKLVLLGPLDAAAGAALGALTSLVTCWFVASVIVNMSWFAVGSAVNKSTIVATMDSVMPPAAQIEGRVMDIIRNADFPQVFASVTAPPATVYPAPAQAVATATAAASPRSVVKVLAFGACGADHEGTGFVVSRGVVMTNAHVIAGATRVTAAGRTATVTALDTSNDLALLRVATDERPSLSFVTTVTAGMPAAVVGFPRDGDLTLTPVALGDSFSAQSRNIYNKVTFTRSLLALAGDIQPGNSGSPVVTGGRVAGVVFSKSLSQRLTGYAIPATVAQSFLNTTGASTSPVSTGACTR